MSKEKTTSKGFGALATIRDQVRKTVPKAGKIRNEFMKYLESGKDHINIFDGRDDLGKFLSGNFASHPFNHTYLGRFATLRGFRFHILATTPVPAFRTLSHGPLQQAAKANGRNRQLDNEVAIIMDAAYQRLLQYPEYIDKLLANKLPLTAYYMQEGYRYEPRNAAQYIQGTMIIRNALRQKKEPDFTPIMTRHDKDLYEDIVPEYLRKQTDAVKEKTCSLTENPKNHGEDSHEGRVYTNTWIKVDGVNDSLTNVSQTIVEEDQASPLVGGSLNFSVQMVDGKPVVTDVATGLKTRGEVTSINDATDS